MFRAVRAVYRKLPVSSELKFRLSTYFYKRLASSGRKSEAQPGQFLKAKSRKPKQVSVITELVFEAPEQPEVTVIIAAYNKWNYTFACLQSILDNLPETSFEIIIVDDCSTDLTSRALESVHGIRVISNETNKGFLLNCNMAAREARGKFLHFLNNDIKVLPGWLDELHRTFNEIPDAGLVGSKLVYPDGTLQEAGGIIWQDGSGWNYGRGDDPNRPEYCFLREPDYCSGASIMVPAKLFMELGGFDERFVPAYYEDTDLAFSVREAGFKVIYQPLSQVIHFEGITSGTDVTQGTKSCQEKNKAKFRDKWGPVLDRKNPRSESIRQASERNRTRQALLIDFETPRPDIDSGSVDTVYYLKMLQHLGFKVVFTGTDLRYSGHYTENLQRSGVECLYKPYVKSLEEYLEENGSQFQLVFMQKVHTVNEYFHHVKKFCTSAKLVFNTVDLHFLREQRYAELQDSDSLRKSAENTRSIEVNIINNTDATIVISPEEKKLVEQEVPGAKVFCLPFVREVKTVTGNFSDRRDIVFIGGFNHIPNIDAVKYFVSDIFPLVRKALPDVVFRIVGSNIPGEVFKEDEVNELLEVPGVELVGHVTDLDEMFAACRLSVAPLRFGAGIKGKIATSLCYGVPCVATSVAVEGMSLDDGKNILVADEAAKFAELVVRACTDEDLWNRISTAGQSLMSEYYSFEKGCQRLETLILSI